MNKAIISILIIIIVLVGGIYLLKQKPSNTNAPETAGEPNTEENIPDTSGGLMTTTIVETSVTTTSEVKSFVVTGKNFSFLPSTIKVKKGDTVKITFKNEGGNHDLKIDEFNVATKLVISGAEETVTFIASKTGSFEYYCSVGNHRAMGMKGILVVE